MKKKNYIKFSQPLILNNEIKSVSKTLKSGWLTTGRQTRKFENNFKLYKKSKYAIALNSCTAGLHLSLLCLNLKKNDEVITSALTFASTVNSIVHAGAKPVLADVNMNTQNIDPDQIIKKITKKTKAIIVVHFAGRSCDMIRINKICRKYNLILIEDCAHAVESTYHGKSLGTFGDFGCFSFYATKNLVTGEGGMVLTKSKKNYEKLKILSLHGMDKNAYKRYDKSGYRHYDISEFGFKYNMMDLQASIGIHQLKRINQNYKKRKKIWNLYNKNFKSLGLVLPYKIQKNIKHAYHLYQILINKKNLISRDQFIAEMHKMKIGIGIHYRSIPEHSVYKKNFGWKLTDYPNANKIGKETISIPLSPALKHQEILRIIKAIKKIFQKVKK